MHPQSKMPPRDCSLRGRGAEEFTFDAGSGYPSCTCLYRSLGSVEKQEAAIMSRASTGQVLERKGKRGTVFALRFRAYGGRRYVTLGRAQDGWDRRRAEEELANVLADVRRGIWRPDTPDAPPEPRTAPTFHEFASEWLERKRPELAPKTIANYEWSLSHHLLPHFAEARIDGISIEDVDRYKTRKLAEGKIAPNAINKTLSRLSQILDEAVEYGYTDRNPAAGRRRKVKGTKPRRSWVEPEQLPSLLDAADGYLRPVLAILVGAGLRLGEAVSLNWGDVNLAVGTIVVRESKTAAGQGRTIEMPEGLRDELVSLKLRSDSIGRGDPVLLNRRGLRQTNRNVDARIKSVIKAANVKLRKAEIAEIEERVTPHSLRRTYSSLRAALGDDPVYIAEQMGHSTPDITFIAYQRAVKRRALLSGRHAEEFDSALRWAAYRPAVPRESAGGDSPIGDLVTGTPPRSGLHESALGNQASED